MKENHTMSADLAKATKRRERGTRVAWSARLLGFALGTLLLAPTLGAQAASGQTCTEDRGQALIDDGRYQQAVREFTCVIDAEPTEAGGYRGRIEAQLLLGRYSGALADYNRVTTVVMPIHPDTEGTILDGYAARLAADPYDIHALTGASFARWWMFDYVHAIQLLDDLLDVRGDDPYGNLFRGSSRLLHGGPMPAGIADIEWAIELDPASPDVRWIVADAYTYGLPDPERAFAEASLALDWGLDTPRVHAILASAHNAFGDLEAAAGHIARHIELVTTELITTPSLQAGDALALDLVPGRTYEIPLGAIAGGTISVATTSRDLWDSIAVLLAPDGSPVVGSDDDDGYFAAFDWVAPATGVYRLWVTSFESISTGELAVSRD
jgi:tetratricopeptide (TPR) repeat protein